MKLLFLTFVIIIQVINAKYLDNHSCKECHEKIYEEYETSAHSKSFFTDELHRKIALKANSKKYDCAICHMPAANNLKDLVTGKAMPDKNNKTHTDAVSCFFCHTIAYVKKAHKFNINTKAKQAKNYKPTLYGRLTNPEDSDKHSAVKNPIYGKMACLGCHSHKLNDNNVTIFKAMDKNQDSIKCIECHMPEVEGGVEKLDKRARGHHASHKFLGIRDKKFRAKGVDINISAKDNTLEIKLTNKMGHPLIIQPARAKYLEIKVIRDGKVIWQNYKQHPNEDKKAYFAYSFKKNGKKIVIPAKATSFSVNNLERNESKILKYKTIKLKTNDKIIVSLWVQLAKDECSEVIDLKDKSYLKPMLIKRVIKRY
jgi:hypothetical protein